MRKLIFIILILFGCSKKEEVKEYYGESEVDARGYSTNRIISTVILGEEYKARFKTDDFVYLYNSKDEIILSEPEGNFDISFKDFDGDSLDDFTIGYMGANRGYQKLFLFDKENKKFRQIKDFENYSVVEKINNTKYYFSYRQDGCANNYWTSDLFYIENYKINRIGSLYTNECYEKKIAEITEQEFKDKYTINITKFVDGKAILLEKLDARILVQKDNYKSEFLNTYWKKNYKLFDTENKL